MPMIWLFLFTLFRILPLYLEIFQIITITFVPYSQIILYFFIYYDDSTILVFKNFPYHYNQSFIYSHILW